MADCFQCGKELIGVGKTNKELAKDNFPLFCSDMCLGLFPDNGSEEFKKRMVEVQKR